MKKIRKNKLKIPKNIICLSFFNILKKIIKKGKVRQKNRKKKEK